MVRLKGCPRCKGDVAIHKDHHGWYEQCIQCGFLRDLPPTNSSTREGDMAKSKAAA